MTDHGPVPESERGGWLRIPGAGRSRLGLRAFAALGLICALTATLIAPPRPLLIWNVSRSAPVGLYRVEYARELSAGDMVAARVPSRWRALGAARRYIPVNVPLIKRIAAGPADQVCAAGTGIYIDGRLAARRRLRDRAGRAMPGWSGCFLIHADEHLLLMDDPGSFDGRYFGATGSADIIGRVHLIWPR